MCNTVNNFQNIMTIKEILMIFSIYLYILYHFYPEHKEVHYLCYQSGRHSEFSVSIVYNYCKKITIWCIPFQFLYQCKYRCILHHHIFNNTACTPLLSFHFKYIYDSHDTWNTRSIINFIHACVLHPSLWKYSIQFMSINIFSNNKWTDNNGIM